MTEGTKGNPHVHQLDLESAFARARDDLERLILMTLSYRQPASILDLEDVMPQSLVDPVDLSHRVGSLSERGLIKQVPSMLDTNGTTLFVTTPLGKERGREVLEEELAKNFPTVKRIFLTALLEAFPAAKPEFTPQRLFQLVEAEPEKFLEMLSEKSRA